MAKYMENPDTVITFCALVCTFVFNFDVRKSAKIPKQSHSVEYFGFQKNDRWSINLKKTPDTWLAVYKFTKLWVVKCNMNKGKCWQEHVLADDSLVLAMFKNNKNRFKRTCHRCLENNWCVCFCLFLIVYSQNSE